MPSETAVHHGAERGDGVGPSPEGQCRPVALHLEGEDIADFGLAPNPTVLATMELDAVA